VRSSSLLRKLESGSSLLSHFTERSKNTLLPLKHLDFWVFKSDLTIIYIKPDKTREQQHIPIQQMSKVANDSDDDSSTGGHTRGPYRLQQCKDAPEESYLWRPLLCCTHHYIRVVKIKAPNDAVVSIQTMD